MRLLPLSVVLAWLVCGPGSHPGCEAAAVKIGFLVDWGLTSPLYPAAAQAAVPAAARALQASGVLPAGDSVEWVWHDTACDAQKAFEVTETLVDTYGVDILVGPACCSSATAASMVAARKGVPLISWACSAEHLSDKMLYPSFLRVVGSNDNFSAALGSLLRRQAWEGVTVDILFAEGASRGLIYATLARQMRERVMQERGVSSLGVFMGFDGRESCAAKAGGAEGVRRAVDALGAAAAGGGGGGGGTGSGSVAIVLGECADYRQVMTYADSKGLKSAGRAWFVLSAARDPACHVSAATCGSDDGRDASALSALSGAVSIDWAPQAPAAARSNVAAFVEAAAALDRENFAEAFFPPPAGDKAVAESRPSSAFFSGVWSALPRQGGSADGGQRRPCAAGVVAQGDGSGGGGVCPAAAAGEYRAVPLEVPGGVLRAAALVFDAVELGGRVLAAAAADADAASADAGADADDPAGGEGRRGGERVGGVGWAELAEGIEFEGLSGKVAMDSLGNRKEMDVSFWLIESLIVGGSAYTSGTEAARYSSASETLQLLRDIQWPPTSPAAYCGKGAGAGYRDGGARTTVDGRTNGLMFALDSPFGAMVLGLAALVSLVVVVGATLTLKLTAAGAGMSPGAEAVAVAVGVAAAEARTENSTGGGDRAEGAASMDNGGGGGGGSNGGVPSPGGGNGVLGSGLRPAALDKPPGNLQQECAETATTASRVLLGRAGAEGGERNGRTPLQMAVAKAALPDGEAAKTPPGVEGRVATRSKMVQEELEKTSSRVKKALKEVEVDSDLLAVGDTIGSGSFSEVRQGHLFGPAASGSIKVAVKALRDVRPSKLRQFWFEVLIMKELNHANIVRLIGASWRGPQPLIILEYVSRGNLATVLEVNPELSWSGQKFEMCIDIAAGMAYLHRFRYFDEFSNSMQNCIIHRDLKPQNLLVTHDFRVKITDFGAATGKADDPRTTQVGTLLYIAPEVVKGECYDERCDVYSFGLVLLAMAHLRGDIITLFTEEILRRGGTVPSAPDGRGDVYMAITNKIVNEGLRPTLPSSFFATMNILIEQCWEPIAAFRPTFEEILEFLQTIARDEIIDGQSLKVEKSDPLVSSPATTGKEFVTVSEYSSYERGDELVLATPKPDAAVPAPAGADAVAAAAAAEDEASQGMTAAAVAAAVHADGKQPIAFVDMKVWDGERHFTPRQSHARRPDSSGASLRAKKRGKNFVPVKGSSGWDFLESCSTGWLEAQTPRRELEERRRGTHPPNAEKAQARRAQPSATLSGLPAPPSVRFPTTAEAGSTIRFTPTFSSTQEEEEEGEEEDLDGKGGRRSSALEDDGRLSFKSMDRQEGRLEWGGSEAWSREDMPEPLGEEENGEEGTATGGEERVVAGARLGERVEGAPRWEGRRSLEEQVEGLQDAQRLTEDSERSGDGGGGAADAKVDGVAGETTATAGGGDDGTPVVGEGEEEGTGEGEGRNTNGTSTASAKVDGDAATAGGGGGDDGKPLVGEREREREGTGEGEGEGHNTTGTSAAPAKVDGGVVGGAGACGATGGSGVGSCEQPASSATDSTASSDGAETARGEAAAVAASSQTARASSSPPQPPSPAF